LSTIKRGFFITFEGNEGSGKSTQMRMLVERLRAAGHNVLESQEPGGSPIGLKIRAVLLDPANAAMSPTAEMLLMFAARAQNVDQWILPALAQGQIVVSDRFTDSTLAYQGAGRGLGSEIVLEVDRIACRGLVPDLTICVDIDVEEGLRRAHHRNRQTETSETRLDEETVDFYKKARAAYHRLAEEEPDRFKLIDGSPEPEVVAQAVWRAVTERLASLAR
jgi:dTMP kinase